MKLKNLEIKDAKTTYNRILQFEDIAKRCNAIERLFTKIEAYEYPNGVYLITPSDELIKALIELGAVLPQPKKTHAVDDHNLFLNGLEYVFRDYGRPEGETSFLDEKPREPDAYKFRFELRNGTTYYFQMVAYRVFE